MIGCRRQSEIVAAVRRSRWTPALDAHARACRSCGEVRLVADALRAPVAMPARSIDAGLLWTCARHIRRVRAMSRMELVGAAGQLSALLVVCGVASSFVDWTALHQLLAGVPLSTWAGVATILVALAIGLTRLAAGGSPEPHEP